MNLSKSIFELQLGVMKNQLKLGEFKFGGKESDQFKYFKEMTMNHFFDGVKRFYQQMTTEGLFEKCSCGANLRHGWTSCEACAGSGFVDKKKF